MSAPVRWVPPGAKGHFGQEAAEIAELMGRPLDAEQRDCAADCTVVDAKGRWLTLESLLVMPRQNGKTAGVVTAVTFADFFLGLGGADNIMWTAHRFKTTTAAFEDHRRLIESTPDLDARVRKIRASGVEHSIELLDGSKIEYLARSKASSRGLGGKRVVVDEALFWGNDQAAALLPVMAARANPHVAYASSAALASDESSYLRQLVRRGRSGSDPSLVALEYAAPGGWSQPGCDLGADCSHEVGAVGCSLDNQDLWRIANPAIKAGRVRIETLQSLRASLDPISFGREFLGWHERGGRGGGGPIDAGAWAAAADPRSQIEGRPVMAIATSRDGRTSAISAAGWRADGLPHVETVVTAPGDAWVVQRAGELRRAQRPRRWVLDGKTAAVALLGDLAAQRVRPDLIDAPKLAAACASFLSRVKAGTVRHLGAGDPSLTDAAGRARRRGIGVAMWAWAESESEGDIVALEAATLALWALETAPRVRAMVATR